MPLKFVKLTEILKTEKDNTFDVTLVLGPLYHLYTEEDKKKCHEMRESGRYGFYSAREELIAGKILKRISELVNIVEKIK